MIYICCCFRSRWWWFYSSYSPPSCDKFFLFLFTVRLKISPNKYPVFSRVSQKDSLFGNYDDSVLFTRAYFRVDETLFREAQNHSSWDRMDAMECKARRRSFFMKGFGSARLRFLPRTPGCENSTAKAPLFWLIKSATIPLFCLEKFRSRALPQFLPTLSLATNETKMCARIRAHEVVKDFFSHRFRDFMRATSLLDA